MSRLLSRVSEPACRPAQEPQIVSSELIRQIESVERNRMREQEEQRPRPVAVPAAGPRPYDAD